MPKTHVKNTVRYYLVLLVFLSFLFFSNDFGLTDVQKTAIVTAVGIDREADEFLITSQVAVPNKSQEGSASQSVQLVSRGKTVAEAFEQLNAKTGWYPKLVFCKLIVLGEGATQENAFDALDFFLRDEYLSDDCQLAACRGSAKDLLNVTPLIDPSSSLAVEKVLSAHAERVGSVRPTTLKDFAIGYFGDSQSGLLPVVKQEEQQENLPSMQQKKPSSNEQSGGSAGNGEKQQGKNGNSSEKTVLSAGETALFVRGRWLDTLTSDETFAVNAAVGKLRLASYSVEVDETACTLLIKHNDPKIKLRISKEGRGELQVQIKLTAGVSDYAKAQTVEETKDFGVLPSGTFAAAEKRLTSTLVTAFEKAKGVGCDLFGLQERLVKFKRRKYFQHKDALLDNTTLRVTVLFEGLR